MSDILSKIIEKRKSDIDRLGLSFGCEVPKIRSRALHHFMAEKGLILEVKRASPSKGDIAPALDSYKTAFSYAECGARAISCLTEQNYFKGTLVDLQNVCRAVDDYAKKTGKNPPAVLRKDFLLSADEIELSYRAGADAVLLISRILEKENFLEMAKKVVELGLYALIEVRSDEDLEKLDFVMSHLDKSHFVCGVNSRDLATFKIDLLRPVMMKEKIRSIMENAGGKSADGAKIIFESGVTSAECAETVGNMGFSGILLGEAAAKNPEMAKTFVDSFNLSKTTKNAAFWEKYASSLATPASLPDLSRQAFPRVKICGLTRAEDATLADELGAEFLGFIFSDKFPRSVSHENRLEKLLEVLPNLKAKKVCVITETESETAKKAIQLVKEGVFDILQFHKIPYEKIEKELLALPHYFAVSSQKEKENLILKGEFRVLLDSKERLQDKKSDFCSESWLAGGINTENFNEIVSVYKPELIDISSGVEKEGEIGIKDKEKLKKILLC
ncbi:MAG: bifunctional indole-3-glycerol phosphate synthase/phosphoribosylanthranilate isomerase [Treponema sp.]|nr:bifunctional indole-3-glycerol phosphate synthase/phosphoribosylanthranilate isomerase [Treponema sp.]